MSRDDKAQNRDRRKTAVRDSTRPPASNGNVGEKHKYDLEWLQTTLYRIAWTQEYFWSVATLCILADVFFTFVILFAIQYTEIDFKTYMQQARLFIKGERVYHKITGDTGPCVYPALHLYIYSLIYYATDSGTEIWNGQVIFSFLYLATQLAAIATYRAACIPPIVLPLLIFSKRLHSIFILRLFNDCWAMFFLYLGVWSICNGRWRWGSILYSLALGVKMNILLYAPAMTAIYFQAVGLQRSIVEASIVVGLQIFIGLPFLRQDASSYLSSAFNLSRAFLYEWTVNLRFINEVIFLDKRLATCLLTIHATLCLLWLTFRWTGFSQFGIRWIKDNVAASNDNEKSKRLSSRLIVTALYTCNLIGITFSRSLHYQFYSWYAQQIPLLVYLSTLPNLVKIAIPLCIESAWNTFPSTAESSLLLLACHLALLYGLWQARQDDANIDRNTEKQISTR